jgi:hypothetical protein
MSGAIPLSPLHAFTAWTGTTLAVPLEQRQVNITVRWRGGATLAVRSVKLYRRFGRIF